VNRSFEWIIVTLKRCRAVVAALLLGFVVLPVGADVPGQPDGAREAATGLSSAYPGDTGMDAAVWPADEPKGRLQTMMQFAPALLMLSLVALGLTITFTSLRKDMKQRRRVVYRPRGPRSTSGSEEVR
jgi:hypothetical protein